MMNNTISQLLSALQETDSVLLFSHISPDGDTLGSTLALRLLLEEMGKRVELVLDGKAPENLRFLPGVEDYLEPKAAKCGDMAIAVDVSCEERLGEASALFGQSKKTVVIDHHRTNDGFGQINWIDGNAPATAVLIYRLFQEWKRPMTEQQAVCLYTALATDTGNFVYESVNAECFQMMAALMDAGLPLAECSRVLFREKRESFVRLLGVALPSLRVSENGKVAGMQMTMEQFRANQLNPVEVDGVINYAIDLVGVRMAYFAHETEKGNTKVSFRALSPYRIDHVAAEFSGGGHALAAGCTVSLPVKEAVALIEEKLLGACAMQKTE
ncbi:MAG: bifunctional oligoribonuclease/PAP phosphatase NrnA [Eubacteriales bacterium]|nr:bifunctional oligoribonuclease/PAP phosphatase NrnA [Eubacteriales bacterium]